MRPRAIPFIIVSLALLLLYAWTFTGRLAAAVQVTDGHCVATVYGRRSAIACPGLAGGSVALYHEATRFSGDPRGRFAPPSRWEALQLTGDGAALSFASPLPDSFAIGGHLRHPDAPGGLVFRRPGEDTGWVFILNGRARSGEWWEWADGRPSTPLAGITVDTPFVVQAQSLLRLVLGGWLGAMALLAAAWALGKTGALGAAVVTRLRPNGGDRSRSAGESAAGVPAGKPQYPNAPESDIQRDRHSRLVMRNSGIGPGCSRYLALALTLAAFAIALHVSVNVLERLPHVQDSLTYLFQAQALAAGELAVPAPPLSGPQETPHFRQEFLLVRDGRWFGKYPPGFPAVLALGVAAGGHWLVNPLLAALTIPAVYALARQLYEPRGRRRTDDGPQTTDRGRATPNVAYQRRTTNHQPPTTIQPPHTSLNTGPPVTDLLNTDPLTTLLLTASPFFLVMSGSLMAHPAELWWTVLFMLAWTKALRRGRARWALVAGAAVGLLFLTRQITAVVVGLSFGGGLLAASLWRFRAQPASGRRSTVTGNIRSPLRPRSTAPLLFMAALAFSPFVVALLAHQAALTGDPLTDPRLLYWPYDRLGFGPDIGEPENVYTYWQSAAGPAIQWATDPAQPPRGHTPSRGLYNLGRNVTALEQHLFGWPPLFTLAFIWLAFLLRRPTTADSLLLLLLAAIAAGYVAFWASGIAYGPRYLYAALPALALLTARGIGALAAAVGRRPTALLVAFLIGFNLVRLPGWIGDYRGYNFVSGENRAAIEAAVEPPALVFVSVSEVDWWEYGAFFTANTPFLDGPFVYARDRGDAENDRLRAAFPGRAAYLWRDGRLTALGP